MEITLILALIGELPTILADFNQIKSLQGNTQAKIDAITSMVLGLIPDNLAPIVPEIKAMLSAAVKVADNVLPLFMKSASATAVSNAAQTIAATVTTTVSTPTQVTGVVTPTTVTGLGPAMPTFGA